MSLSAVMLDLDSNPRNDSSDSMDSGGEASPIVVEVLCDVGANMEVVSSEDHSYSLKTESILVSTKRKPVKRQFEPVPISKAQIQQFIVGNSATTTSASSPLPVRQTPGLVTSPLVVTTQASVVTPVTPTPIVSTTPHRRNILPSTTSSDSKPATAKPASPMTQFVKIAPKPPAPTSTIISPLQIQWPGAGNVTTILQYAPTPTPLVTNNLPAPVLLSTKPVASTPAPPAPKPVPLKPKKGPCIIKLKECITDNTKTSTSNVPTSESSMPTPNSTCDNKQVSDPLPTALPTLGSSNSASSPNSLNKNSGSSSSALASSDAKKPRIDQDSMTKRSPTPSIPSRPPAPSLQDKDKVAIENLPPLVKLHCRSIRMGSYKVTPDPGHPVLIEKNQITITVPPIGDDTHLIALQLSGDDIAKVLASLGRHMPAIFIYPTADCAEFIRGYLNMADAGASEGYLDPASTEESQKKITLLPSSIEKEHQLFIRSSFLSKKLWEVNHKIANSILVRSTPNILTIEVPRLRKNKTSSSAQTVAGQSFVAPAN